MSNVKVLSWEACECEQVAQTPFGAYRFFEKFSPAAGRAVPVVVFSCCDETALHLVRKDDLTFDEARNIAQADFEERVRACLI